MTHALIGFSGFVGSNLRTQHHFDHEYNSKNIDLINDTSFELVVCSAAPAEKWRANSQPDLDLENIQKLMQHLATIRTTHFVLISTVDVYPNPNNVYENTPIEPDKCQPYGKHRFLLEEFIRARFENLLIIRLPGLFGNGIKKNLIYDLLFNNRLDLTDCNSVFQFYNLDRLWRDITISIDANLSLVNLATEPVSAREVAMACTETTFHNRTEKPPVKYDMRTLYADILGGNKESYIQDKHHVLSDISAFSTLMRGKAL